MTTYTLALNFDIEQRLDNLQYKIYPSDGEMSTSSITNSLDYKEDSKQVNGLFAGCYRFEAGDKLKLQINVTNELGDELNDLSITNMLLDVVCLPSVRNNPSDNGQNDGLSPYAIAKASNSIQDWSNLPRKVNQTLTVFSSETTLPIKSTGGEWVLKGYLSVVLNVNKTVTQRVFSFDPVVIVGTGKGRN